jgi:thiol-disulfide isomerase/thioredoxin
MLNYRPILWVIIVLALLTGCGGVPMSPAISATPESAVATVAPANIPAATATPGVNNTPEPPSAWVSVNFTDATTGKIFTINDFKGKVVVVVLMAAWCPNCRNEGNQLKILRSMVGPDDLEIISLDIDLNEDAAVLKKYTQENGFDWRYAVAPIEAMRDIGNLYGALFMDPTLSPTLVVARQGEIYKMNFGYKKAEDIRKAIDPLLKAKP